MPVNRFYILWGVLFFLSGQACLLPQEKTPTNQDILIRLLISPALKLIKSNIPSQKGLSITSPDNSPLSKWLVQILTDSCLQQKYLVYSPPRSDSVSAYVVEVTAAQSEIQYRSGGRKWLVFPGDVKREVQGSSHLQIKDERGRVLSSQEIRGRYADHIPRKVLPVMENEKLEFTRGVHQPSAFRKKWLEPILITATTATVIVLFYTLRSQ